MRSAAPQSPDCEECPSPGIGNGCRTRAGQRLALLANKAGGFNCSLEKKKDVGLITGALHGESGHPELLPQCLPDECLTLSSASEPSPVPWTHYTARHKFTHLFELKGLPLLMGPEQPVSTAGAAWRRIWIPRASRAFHTPISQPLWGHLTTSEPVEEKLHFRSDFRVGGPGWGQSLDATLIQRPGQRGMETHLMDRPELGSQWRYCSLLGEQSYGLSGTQLGCLGRSWPTSTPRHLLSYSLQASPP